MHLDISVQQYIKSTPCSLCLKCSSPRSPHGFLTCFILQKMLLFPGGLPWTVFQKFQSPNPTPTFSIILFWFFFYSFTAYKYYWLSSAQTLESIPWREKILTVLFSAVSSLAPTISGTQNSKKYMWMNWLLNQSISPFRKRKINWS